jgi:hypothetical protein
LRWGYAAFNVGLCLCKRETSCFAIVAETWVACLGWGASLAGGITGVSGFSFMRIVYGGFGFILVLCRVGLHGCVSLY